MKDAEETIERQNETLYNFEQEEREWHSKVEQLNIKLRVSLFYF